MASSPLSLTGADPEMSATLGRRRVERFRVLVPGTLELLDGEFACAVEDVSTDGARIICDAPMRTGQRGVLKCFPLDVLFYVAWVRDKTMGLTFDQAASLGEIRQLRWHNDCNRHKYDEQLRTMLQGWISRGKADEKIKQLRRI